MTIESSRGIVFYPDLSYRIVGALFDVWREIGYCHKEKYIQGAIESALKEKGISFSRELKTDLKFKEDKIGIYFLDFLIEDRVILEIKREIIFRKTILSRFIII